MSPRDSESGERDEAVERARRAAERHESFESQKSGGYRISTTAFEGSVALDADGGTAEFAVTVRVPTLDAVTEDRVGSAVAEGWFETLALRLEDVDSALRGDDDPELDVERDVEEVVVRIQIADLDAGRAAGDAVAAVEYVEGTYVQGIVPGYDYTEPVTNLLQRASDAAGGTQGGTPL
jgi:hypothetical protein